MRRYKKAILAFVSVAFLAMQSHAHAQSQDLSQCTRIASSLQRLACFDKLAGTPLMSQRTGSSSQRYVPEVILEVAKLEKARPQGETRFRMVQSIEDATTGQRRVVISAPALNAKPPKPLMAVSCIANITRLQFIVHPPTGRNQANVELIHEGRIVAPRQTWQVLEQGRLVDAGRGLVGIDVVRRLGSGKRLEVRSDLPQLNGLVFDSEGLFELIEIQRNACRW